jgi:putative oxygen-independent coproporphyrinogen III oxidase
VRMLVPLDADAEVTLEANPGTLEAGKFRDFRALGINRLSVGVQSFDDASLVALGRIHDGRQARAALAEALIHFDSVNLDLMYALPNQSLEQACADLATALAFSPAHLSLYHLTLEPNTVFAKYPPPLPSDDLAAHMQEALQATLNAAGVIQYEVSAYARAGRRSRHNLNYWNFGDYLGIGPGAHSKLSFAERIVRQARHRQPATYLERAQQGESLIAEDAEVASADLGFEFMLNALRLVEGFPIARFKERTGLALSVVEAPLLRAEQKGLIVRDHLTIRPSALGLRFLNDLQALFLPE